MRCYVAAARDAILASILEAAHSAGYGGVHVLSNKDARFALTLRLHPLSVRSDADLEAVYLSALAGKDAATAAAWEGYAHGLLLEFNANVPYSGPGALFFKDKKNERIIAPALQRLVRLGRGWLPKGSVAAADADAKEAALSVLGAMRRLVATQPGIDAVCTTPELGPQLIGYAWGCLEWPALDVSGAAIEVLSALTHHVCDPIVMSQELQCKRMVLNESARRELLVSLLTTHLKCGTGALLLAQILEVFAFVLCHPHAETTPPECFEYMMALVAGIGRPFYRFFSHACLRVAKAAGLLMSALVEEGDDKIVLAIRHDALCEGALLEQFVEAVFLQGNDARAALRRTLSRRLVALWAAGYQPTTDVLFRILPAPLLRVLSSKDAPPENTKKDPAELIERRREGAAKGQPKANWLGVGKGSQRKSVEEEFAPRKRRVRADDH